MFRKALLFSTALTLLGLSAAWPMSRSSIGLCSPSMATRKTGSSSWTPMEKSLGNTSRRACASFFRSCQTATLSIPMAAIRPGSMKSRPTRKSSGRYHAKCPQVICCLRLDNGHTLVGQQGPPQIVEVDHDGKTVHVTPCTTSEVPYHRQVRGIRSLPEGHLLVAHEGEGAIREYDPLGKVVWQYEHVDNTGDSIRLANGNTLISGATQKRVLEVTPAGKIAWEFTDKDAPRPEPHVGLKPASAEERPLPDRQFSAQRRQRRPRLRSHERQKSRLDLGRPQTGEINHDGAA